MLRIIRHIPGVHILPTALWTALPAPCRDVEQQRWTTMDQRGSLKHESRGLTVVPRQTRLSLNISGSLYFCLQWHRAVHHVAQPLSLGRKEMTLESCPVPSTQPGAYPHSSLVHIIKQNPEGMHTSHYGSRSKPWCLSPDIHTSLIFQPILIPF